MRERDTRILPGDRDRTKEQLINELEGLRRRIAEFDHAEIMSKKTEDESQDSGNFYKNILDNITTGVWVSDKDDKICYANNETASIAGIPLHQITGSGVLSDFPEEARDAFIPYYLNARETLKPVYYESVPIVTPSGRLSFQTGWLVPKLRDGSFDGMVCTVVDVTDRKWMEDALRESEEHARSFVESSQDCVCNITTDGKYMSMNPAGCTLNDVGSQEDIIGMNCTENIVENREAFEKAISKAAKGTIESIQYRTVSKKDKEIWWDCKLTPVKDLDGSIKSILQVSRDISEYKQMEKSLLHTQEMLIKEHSELSMLFKRVEAGKKEWENTMDCVGDMLILTGMDGSIKRYNKALLQFTNKYKGDLIGKDWENVMSESGLESVTFYAGSIEMFHKPTLRWFTLSSYPFKDSSLEHIGTVILLHETTEIKKITGELETAYEELKATQAQILQREKMASIGQLAAGVAHEINNPMGFITSNLGTLDKYIKKITDYMSAQTEAVESFKSTEVSGQLKEMHKKLKLDYVIEDIGQLIEESQEGAERVKRIVQNLKTFSRVDQAEYNSADINECIESTLNIVWNELKYKAAVQKEYGEIPLTRCYPQQLNQVFVNLLVNAAQAIEKQGEIKIKTWNGDGIINISISDTGSGIPEDKLHRIFEPFFTTKEVGKGTGLGLSICYDIVKKHNGEITVESEVGKGTIFNIKIPVIEEK